MPKPPAETVEGERRYRAPALEKGLDILEVMARHGAAMTASQIAAALDRSMSELFRMILVLEYKGYLVQAASGDGYELSNKLFTLGMARAPVRTLLEVALPVMRSLSGAIGQSCHLAVASGDEMVVVARVESPGYLGFTVRPGYRRSVLEASSGAVLFAFQPERTRADWAARLKREVGPAKIKAFVDRTDQLRERGYEQAPSDFVPGVTDISSPIVSSDGVAAALTVPFLLQRARGVGSLEEALTALRLASRTISEDLSNE